MKWKCVKQNRRHSLYNPRLITVYFLYQQKCYPCLYRFFFYLVVYFTLEVICNKSSKSTVSLLSQSKPKGPLSFGTAAKWEFFFYSSQQQISPSPLTFCPCRLRHIFHASLCRNLLDRQLFIEKYVFQFFKEVTSKP